MIDTHRWRMRAEELRTLADELAHDEPRAAMLHLADQCDRRADFVPPHRARTTAQEKSLTRRKG